MTVTTTDVRLEDVDLFDLVRPSRYRESRPHDVWAALRRHSPVHWTELDGFKPFWTLTRHADIRYVSTQPELFSSAGRLILAPDELDMTQQAAMFPDARNVLNTDPPEHRQWRNMAGPYFRPRPLRLLEDRVREISVTLLEDLTSTNGELISLDFATDVATWHPLRMIAELLGADQPGDEQSILSIANGVFGSTDDEYGRDMGEVLTETFQFLGRLVREKRANPGDDLASILAHAQLNGQPINDMGLLGYLLILITAGHDTTRHSMTYGMAALMDHPDQLRRLQEDPSLIPGAVEEIVRLATPVMQFMRTATQDTEIDGVPIAKGQEVVLFYPSANVDDSVFEDPFEFRIDRDPNPHLAFGVGEHYCLGAALARMELRVMLEELLPRLEHIEPAGERTSMATTFVSGIKHLPVRWRLAPR